MTRKIEAVTAASGAEEAWALMRMKGVHHLIVRESADAGSKFVGVLSNRDLGSRNGAGVRKGRTVEDLMTHPVVTVDAREPIRKAANVMRGRSIGSLVVTEAGRAVGIITISDLLELVGRGLDRPVETTTRRPIGHRAPHRKRYRSAGSW